MNHTQQLEPSMLNLRGVGIGAGIAKRLANQQRDGNDSW